MLELEYEIELLSRLIDIAADCARSVRGEAERAKEETARALLFERSEVHDDIALELQTRVRELGGEPFVREEAGRNEASRHVPGARSGELGREIEMAVSDTFLSAATRMVLRSCLEILRNEGLEPQGEMPVR
jgi:hypothetical protein